ncbi:MAG: energy transducer TonB [Bacteroidota bacterium]
MSLLLSTLSAIAQDSNGIYSVVDTMPSFLYGDAQLLRFVRNNIHHPVKAKLANIEGKVYISMVIDTNGHIREAEILRDIGGGCGAEALKTMLRTDSMWIPGRHHGKAVPVRITQPIKFVCNGCEEIASGATGYEYKVDIPAEQYYNLGVAEFQAERPAIAIYYFSRALDKDPTYVDALYNRGVCNFQLGKPRMACRDWISAQKHGDEAAGELIGKYCK